MASSCGCWQATSRHAPFLSNSARNCSRSKLSSGTASTSWKPPMVGAISMRSLPHARIRLCRKIPFFNEGPGDPAMTIKVAINGYGRIGRNILRAHYEDGKKHDIAIVAINDLGSPETNAHLTRHDTAHGKFPGKIQVDCDSMVVDG